MTEYDYSPEAHERYRATLNRVANWVDNTEQHRGEFQSGNAPLPDLPRSGPVSHPKSKKKPSPSPPRRGQSRLAIHPPPPQSDSSDSYYEGPWPAQIPHQGPAMVLPQQPGFQPLSPPMMLPHTYVTSPHRVSHHHRHRPHDQPRSRSHQSPAYYASPPLAPGYPYPYTAGYPGYPMMQPYSGSQVPVMSTSAQPPRSAPADVTTFSQSYPQLQFAAPTPTAHLQPSPPFLVSNSQPCSPQPQPYGNLSPPYSRMSTPTGSSIQPQPYVGVPTYQAFVVPQPAQQSYLVPPMVHQRIYDPRHPDSDKYYKLSVG